MDDRQGVRAARNKGFRVIGTLRVLDLGARRGLVNYPRRCIRADQAHELSLPPGDHGRTARSTEERMTTIATISNQGNSCLRGLQVDGRVTGRFACWKSGS